jgi:hypothetical protein
MTDEEKLVRWLQIRQKGKAAFIWKYGFVRYAFPLCSFLAIYIYYQSPIHDWFMAILSVIFFAPLAGLGFGYWAWSRFEKMYDR